MMVEVVEFAKTKVAVLEHCGPASTLMASVQKFIAWRKSCGDSPNDTSRTFGVPHGDPETTPPESWRFDICGEAVNGVSANTHGVIEKALPGGPCAKVTHLGPTDAIGPTVLAIYKDWLPSSGYVLRDFPVFFHYIKRMPEVSEHDQVTDIYLPLSSPE